MSDPVILARAEHSISRRNIDSDALRVLYRLHEHGHAAYLVGGSVRDLLLSRRPKDFDIGTDAHPYQIKRLFRNCWIIGRRFRLAHVKFGPKTIEVATFRRNVSDAEAEAAAAVPEAVVVASSNTDQTSAPAMIHRDNTYGTPEEDAFRRDFTINGLFYDIATFAVIDFVGGLGDLERRVVRSIGDPRVRFVEDPVRMLRAAVMAARLGFELDPLVAQAIAEHRSLILKASPARLLEEYYKILRSGSAKATFQMLRRVGLLPLITPELASPPEALWESLSALDEYRRAFAEPPLELTNAILVGALLTPLGLLNSAHAKPHPHPHADRVTFGILPIARKDLDRLRQTLQLLPRLVDPALPTRVARGIANRPVFPTALTWVEIFGGASPALIAEWKQVRQHRPSPHPDAGPAPEEPTGDAPPPPNRRRRRRRRRGRRKPAPPQT